MDPASSSDPLLDLARRISDGKQIDWDALASTIALLRRLKRVSRIAQAQRDIRAADPLANLFLASPREIADYRIRRQIGAGGLGVVYEAEQRHPRRAVALKVIRGSHAANDHAIRWFQREARTLALLKHPGIASIFASGQAESGEHFIAMELVRGKTLADWLESRAVTPADSKDEQRLRLAVFHRICEAVAYAHRRGVIHRDLKPSNILVTSDSGDLSGIPGVKILDFGLAHAAFATVITEIGRVQGTLRYMSPEQILGDADEIDTRTDIYSLGIILYELLTGALPYEIGRGSLREKAQTVCETVPRPWTEVWTGSAVPRDLEAIARKALEKSPAARYPTVHALIEDVDRFLAEDSQPESRNAVARGVLHRPLPRILGRVVLIALLAYAAIVSVLLVREQGGPEPQETVQQPGSSENAP
jgi:serine/threonine protein kinase